MAKQIVSEDHWRDDRLGYRETAQNFTKIIQSITDGKVISIEAGFGRGKTFFRTAWAKDLQQAGETIIQLDLLKSDHTGDPVVTLLGAMIGAVPPTGKSKLNKAKEVAKKIGAVAFRATAHAVLRGAATEIIDAISEQQDPNSASRALKNVGGEVGRELTKAASDLIDKQLEKEKIRTQDLPNQLEALKETILGDKDGRIVIIVDEFDRCHPDYAISFLEATKVIFGSKGFVFCLMVDPDYLEGLARHKFGGSEGAELYLEKFVDFRFKLKPKPDALAKEMGDRVRNFPSFVPFGDHETFSKEFAADLTEGYVISSGYTARQAIKAIETVELVLRTNPKKPIDLPLLLYKSFMKYKKSQQPLKKQERFTLSVPKDALRQKLDRYPVNTLLEFCGANERNNDALRSYGELCDLPGDRFKIPTAVINIYPNLKVSSVSPGIKVFAFLAQYYVKEHEDLLDGISGFYD